ncbi:MAG: IS1380 family transposase [Candidatus Omnitrophica bacterium]|nr:IS1380 family transposase [Candidatus Omnitrophota bacterium]
MRLTKKLSQVTLKKSEESVTGRMGLSWLAGSMSHFGLEKIVLDEYGDKKGSNREKAAHEKIMTGVMMMVSGGERVEDVEILRADQGLKDSLGWEEMVCADTVFNFIEDRRKNAKNRRINDRLVVKALRRIEAQELTYDNDATYMDSGKDSAEYSYQKRKQFSGLLGCIAECGLVNTVEYRRGNESPQTGVFNQLRKACWQAEQAGKKIKRFRSDSAAHQDKIFTYCERNEIEYYVSIDKNSAVLKAIKRLSAFDWKTMYGRYEERDDTKWAVTKYTVSKGYKVRILILRWKNPDPTLFDQSPYCYHVIGTNNWGIEPMDWLEIHNGRMGSIEQSHKEIKAGLGCDYTPSHEFEKNRGYFLLGVLAYNMVQIMKLFYLGADATEWTIKTIRYRFIHVCGKIVRSGRRYFCKIINVSHEIFDRFRYCQTQMSLA